MLKGKRSLTPTFGIKSPNKKSPDKKLSTSSLKTDLHHWSDRVKEFVLVSTSDPLPTPLTLPFTLQGGADVGQFPHFGDPSDHVPCQVKVDSGDSPECGDVLLEIQGQKVSGYTRADVEAWMRHCLRNANPVVIRSVSKGRQSYN